MAFWVIGYGVVQAIAPALIRRKTGAETSEPDGHTALWLAFILALFPAGIAIALFLQLNATVAVVAGLILFGIVFALNSSVHSYLILAYTDRDKVAMNVGVYYMANACGRLTGTILSGLLYQIGLRSGNNGGLVLCLLASAVLVLAAALLSLGLPGRKKEQRLQTVKI